MPASSEEGLNDANSHYQKAFPLLGCHMPHVVLQIRRWPRGLFVINVNPQYPVLPRSFQVLTGPCELLLFQKQGIFTPIQATGHQLAKTDWFLQGPLFSPKRCFTCGPCQALTRISASVMSLVWVRETCIPLLPSWYSVMLHHLCLSSA